MNRRQYYKDKYLGGVRFINTGSTMLNLALTDRVNGGWATKRMHNLVGDSSSGKTFIALTSQACCHYDPAFDMNTVYDDAESADSFDKDNLFGKEAAEAIRLPIRNPVKKTSTIKGHPGGPSKSRLLQDFQLHLDTELSRKSCFYTLDSFDAIEDKSQQEKNKENTKAHEEGKDGKGSFSMAKQKNASEYFGGACDKLQETNSCLLVVSQTRAAVNSRFGGTNRSGGMALKFYSCAEVWMREKEKIVKVVNGERVAIGILSEIQVKKNKMTGKRRTVTVPIYYDYGIDDIGSCVTYLLRQKYWKKAGESILVPKWKFKGTIPKLLGYIEADPKREKYLKDCVQLAWNAFEEKLRSKRKPRFG